MSEARLKQTIKDLESCIDRRDKVILHQDNEIYRLQRENDALRARVSRLESVINKVDMYHGHCHDIKCSNESNNECECGHVDAQVSLNETPKQSLAEIEAAAVEKFKQHIISQMNEGLSGDEGCDLIVPIYEFELFKSQLHQQGGE